MNVSESLKLIAQGASQIISTEELEKKLQEGRPLRVKLGVDPTAPDIHLGHSVALEKLRQFQSLGHQAVLIIGDFTATVGDPTGRSVARPPITREEVLANAKTYTQQAFKILDESKTEIVYNGEWFRKMTYEEVLKLNARVTLQQMLQREDFKKRVKEGTPVSIHELQYPIMQGWDSVMVKSDVEIGGTDQLFNNLVGRELQKAEGQSQQVVLLMPLLEGLDGVKKMSKSYGNYIGVNEAPNDMFGKIMSISDDLMGRYYTLLLGETLDESQHPMDAKKALAKSIVTRYHSADLAEQALLNWESQFSKKDLASSDLPELEISLFDSTENLVQIVSLAYEQAFSIKRSNGDIKKQLIATGAIQLNETKLTDIHAKPELATGDVFKIGKKHAIRFK